MAQPNVRDIISDIKHGKTANVYILMGEEAYYIDLIISALEQYVIREEDKDFNYSLFFGNDANLEDVVTSCQQYPFMSDKRLVILKEAQGMFNAKSQLENLAGYVGNPNNGTVFVISYKGDKLNATSKLLKAAKGSGAIIYTSDVPRDYELLNHVRSYCTQHKVSIEDKAAQMLCDYIGAPLSKLFGEMSKLIHIKGGQGARITAEDVEKNIGVSKDFNQFELSRAVARKDYPRAMRIVQYFEKNPKSTPSVMISAALFSLFSNIMIGHYTADKSEQSLMNAMGLKNKYGMNDIRDGMRNYNALQAFNGIRYIREFDAGSKGVGSYQNEFELLKELIFKLFT